MTINQRMHRYLTWLHRWTGLLMMVFLIIESLTGALLVYQTEIYRLINPRHFAKPQPGVAQLSMGQIAERVEAADLDIRVSYFSRDIPDTVLVRVDPRENPVTGRRPRLDYNYIFVDPWTGEILARRTASSDNLMPLVYSIHKDLTLGKPGALVLGYVALAWTIDCFVGFYLTLPIARPDFWGRWRSAWWVKWRASVFRVNFDLHRAGGLWLSPLLFVLAWSSVYLEHNFAYEKVMHGLFSYEMVHDSVNRDLRPIENPRLNWSQAQARGMELIRKECAQRGLRVVRATDMAYFQPLGVYSIGAATDRDILSDRPDSGVYIDGDTGELKELFLPHGLAGNTFTNLIVGLHFADYHGSQVYRLLEFISGLLICLLSVTGVYVWWRKRQGRILAARKQHASFNKGAVQPSGGRA